MSGEPRAGSSRSARGSERVVLKMAHKVQKVQVNLHTFSAPSAQNTVNCELYALSKSIIKLIKSFILRVVLISMDLECNIQYVKKIHSAF